MPSMPRNNRPARRGFGLVDGAIAASILAAAMVPILSFIASSTATVATRESDMLVHNVASSVLDTFATRDIEIERPVTVLTSELLASAGYERDEAPEDLQASLDRLELTLEIACCTTRLGEGRIGTDLRVWTVKARWKDGKKPRSRDWFRVATQG